MKSILATLVGATLLAAVPAQAATDVYLNISGIKGESTVKGHEGAIDVLAWSWGLTNPSLPGAVGGAGRVSLQDLNWTQYLNGSAIQLYGDLVDGTPIGLATLSAARSGPSGYTYFQAEFGGNLITSLATGGSGGEDVFTANISMATTDVTLRYRPTATAQWVEASFSQATSLSGATFSGDPLAFQGLRMAMTSAVPEPASWALMAGGLLLTGVALRRRLPG
jgi:type VI secretion system secreted protein Hcp